MESNFSAKLEEVELAKEYGDEMMRKGDARTAVIFYTQAISIIVDMPIYKDGLLAIILSNRSAAYMKEKQYHNALADAESVVAANPEWYKGYTRLSKAHEALGNYEDSLLMHHNALVTLMNQRVTTESNPLIDEVLLSECSLICRVKDKNQDLAAEYLKKVSECFEVNTMLSIVACKDRFDLLLEILTLTVDTTAKQIIKALFVHPVLNKWYPSQESGCIAGLERGLLTLRDFSNNFKLSPLHFAIFRGRETGSTKLLEYMLKNIFTTKEQIDCLSDHGGTILHYLLLISATLDDPSNSIKVMKCLKKFEHIDFEMKNANGHTVRDRTFIDKMSWWRDFCKDLQTTAGKSVDGREKETSKKQTEPRSTEARSTEARSTEARSTEARSQKHDDVRSDVLTQKDLHVENQKLRTKISHLKQKLEDMEAKKQKDTDTDTSTDDTSVIKCTICDSEVTLESPIAKLPDILAKLGAIQLHD